MTKAKRFILPLAIIKLVLMLVILHLLCSSCEQDELYYSGGLYSEGPVLEFEAQFGDDQGVYDVGDTVYLEIAVEDLVVQDGASEDDIMVVLNSPEFNAAFAFVDDKGEAVFPMHIVESGVVDRISNEVYYVSFSGNGDGYRTSSSALPYLKLGFMFQNVGDYTLYFINTPNYYKEGGSVDVFYDRSLENEEDVKSAYAVYLFNLSSKTQDYDDGDEAYKGRLLECAGFDQAIVDFKIASDD